MKILNFTDSIVFKSFILCLVFLPFSAKTQPKAKFYVSDSLLCDGNTTVTFFNASTNASTYLWDFGNGVTSTSPNPTYTYPMFTFGSFVVKLVAIGGFQRDSFYKVIDIGFPPASTFATEFTSDVCIGTVIDFYNYDISGDNFTWYFGDGDSSNLFEPRHTYKTAGDYWVKLKSTNKCGEMIDSQLVVITNTATGIPQLSVNNPSAFQCKGNAVFMQATAERYDSLIWIVNGVRQTVYDNLDNVYIVNLDTGFHTITVVAKNKCGQISVDKNFKVLEEISPKQVAIISSDIGGGCPSQPIEFDVFGPVTVVKWLFGDGNVSTLQKPIHIYASPGNYEVKAVCKSLCGEIIDTLSDYTITIQASLLPSTYYTVKSATVCLGQPIEITGIYGDTVKYKWYFGDGDSSTQFIPSHIYAAPGMYNLAFYSNSYCGDRGNFHMFVNVVPSVKPSISNFTNMSRFYCPGSMVFFNAIIGNTYQSVEWVFDDGVVLSGTNVKRSFATEGTKLYYIRVKGNCGESFLPGWIKVSSSAGPTFVWQTQSLSQICSGNSVIFSNNLLGQDSLHWDWGDGQTSATGLGLGNISHIYNTQGDYRVVVKTVSNCRVDSIEYKVTVRSKPVPDFSMSASEIKVNETVAFTNLSTNTDIFTYYDWDFSGVGSSKQVNPTFAFAIKGDKVIKLRAFNAFCGADSVSKPLKVLPLDSITPPPTPIKRPIVSFSPNPARGDVSVKITDPGTNTVIKLFDINGKMVLDLTSAITTTGSVSEAIFNTQKLGIRTGYYLIRVETGSLVQTLTLIVY